VIFPPIPDSTKPFMNLKNYCNLINGILNLTCEEKTMDTHKDQLFEKWKMLRNSMKEAKRNKDYVEVINTCELIKILDKEAKFLKILVPLIDKEIGDSYSKLGNKEEAIHYYELAIMGYLKHRKNNKLNKKTDFLNEIEKLEKKIDKLKSK
jgi:tetratricopeptide (TPR) repeat protein